MLEYQKICTTKNSIKDEHKKDIFQKQKNQNQQLSSPMNCQQTHKINTPKKQRCVFQRGQNWKNIQ